MANEVRTTTFSFELANQRPSHAQVNIAGFEVMRSVASYQAPSAPRRQIIMDN